MRLNLVTSLILFIFVQLGESALSKDELKARQLNSQSGVITVQPSEFEEFFSGPKDYFLITLLTTTTSNNCPLCLRFKPVFESVSRSHRKSNPLSKSVFFVEVEATDHGQSFQKYQITTVPHLWVYPISSLIYKDDNIENDTTDMRLPLPEQITIVSEHYTYPIPDSAPVDAMEIHFAKFISQMTKSNVNIDKPYNLWLAGKYCVGFFAFFRLIRIHKEKVIKNLMNGNAFMIGSVAMIFLSMSGLNYCLQRMVPFLTKDVEGQLSFIAYGTQQQVGAEVMISIFFQLCFGFILVLMVDGGKLIKGKKLNILIISLAFSMFINYNVFTTLFLKKNRDYPFNSINIPTL
ncbi:hypothetical protein CANARDRAFT_22211 [[Candida] arabinofermentans NRRL YB-2248]|uniref:Thioredoxin domain-containing protein n=1 Tax=[Candida] arabinofermentans NRRL YB-2248 TaxID=983967 RepID=A0A1E4T3G6_9ASCO|nr:hypothetical protein CANARDRAFT_22211 [[Candida] arabinofermentans NRRL YB-2248]